MSNISHMLESGNIPVLNGSQGIYAQKQGKIKTYLDKHRLNTERGEIVDNSEDICDTDLFNRYFLSMSTVSVKVMNPSTAEWEEVITQANLYSPSTLNTRCIRVVTDFLPYPKFRKSLPS